MLTCNYNMRKLCMFGSSSTFGMVTNKLVKTLKIEVNIVFYLLIKGVFWNVFTISFKKLILYNNLVICIIFMF